MQHRLAGDILREEFIRNYYELVDKATLEHMPDAILNKLLEQLTNEKTKRSLTNETSNIQ